MAEKLPILISIPHGGNVIPDEVKDIVNVGERDIFYDGDAKTSEIYDFKDKVKAQAEMKIARAVIDVNRAPDDKPPKNPDGVVKTQTTDKTPVYKKGKYPDDKTIDLLLEKYYFPFHTKVDKLIKENSIKLCLDCHTMLAEAPVTSKNPGTPRPLICLSNGGDKNGEPVSGTGTITCPPQVIRMLAEFFRAEFGNEGEITINKPFLGGYNSKLHSKTNKIPWIQIEMNRSLYLTEQNINDRSLEVPQEKIKELNTRIWWVINKFFENWELQSRKTDMK